MVLCVLCRYERAVREQRLAAELSTAKRERDFYLSRIDKAKALDAMASRRQRQPPATGLSAEGVVGNATIEEGAGGSQGPKGKQQGSQRDGKSAEKVSVSVSGERVGGRGKMVRAFAQKQSKADLVTGTEGPGLADDIISLLGHSKKRLRAT
jgi:ESF2/ABP1 family protein